MNAYRLKNYFSLVMLMVFSLVFSQQNPNRNLKFKEHVTESSLKAGAFIDVNTSNYAQSSYDITDLVKKVLITGGGTCTEANVTNVVVSPNLAVSNLDRSYGYFHKGTTNFPFNDGIVLSTGYARKAGNAYESLTLSDNLPTGGDQDLANAIGVSNSSLNDAVYIEFDFVPTVGTISFRYLFASEEYTGTFPCSYTDGFALLLKKVGDANYTNLAKLPNGEAVSVTNVRPATTFSGGSMTCGPKNPEYFTGYNNSNVLTNFNGSVVPLTATATVIPGQTYHFKMVLADFSDSSWDSAVFLEAGSFNIGVTFADQNGVTLPPSLVMCDGAPQTLVAQVQTTTPVTYEWYFNDVLIPGANTNTYVATQPGVYKVKVYLQGVNCPSETAVTITSGTSPTVQNATLSQCTNSSTATFNLTTAQPNICATPGVTFTYHNTLAEANANINPLINIFNHVSGTKKLYVRVSNGPCFKVAELQLVVGGIAAPTITASSNIICGSGSVTLTSNSTTGNVWSTGATTQSITVTTPGTYTLKIVNGTCESAVSTINITQEADPNIQISGALTFCEGYSTTLTSSSATGNLWSNGATTQSITVNTPGTYTVTVTTASGCQFSKSVTVVKAPSINVNIANPQVLTCTTTQVTLDATTSVYPTGATFNWTASNGGNIVSGGNTLNPVVNAAGTYTLTITGINCAGTGQVVVTENKTKPVVTLTSNKMAICVGESVTLTASGGQSYTWLNLTGNGNTQTVSPTTTTTYSVTGVGTNGCISNPATITITVVPAITSTLEGGQICNGDNIELDAGAGPNYTYLWSNGATTQKIIVNQIGNYSVTINNGVCSKTFTTEVKQAQIPVITSILYENNSLIVTATNPSNGTLEYSSDLGISWQSSNIFTNVIPNKKYTIMVRVKNTSCVGIAEYFTFKMFNIITPNGDGINETIDLTGISGFNQFKADIFDRYGKLVFSASKNNAIWNGTSNNRPLPTTTYWYFLQYEDPVTKELKKKNGWILLKNRE